MNPLKWFKYRSALAAAVALLMPFACAQERQTPPAVVTQYCSGCHGIDGKSQLSYIPRLAGLNAAYTEHKLARFRAYGSVPVDEAFNKLLRRPGSSKDSNLTNAAQAQMVGTASAISYKEIKAAAGWYASQVPAAGKSGNWKSIEEGRNLFMKGAPSQGLRACQSCHGPEAQGTEKAPRLAGQHAAYILAQIALFRGSDSHVSPEMSSVARSVETDQARAVALYLQSR